MQPFDPKTYPRQVLQPYTKGGAPDAFERYLLDFDDNDDDAIDDRMEDVLRFWNNSRSAPPPVGPLISGMIKEHNNLSGQLGDQIARRALAGDVQAARKRRDTARLRGVDTALRELHKTHGGIPDDARGRLVSLGKLAGLSEAEVNQYVDTVMRREGWGRVEVKHKTTVEPLSATIGDQIRQQLRRFHDTRAQEEGITTDARSLFEALDVQFDADPVTCKAAIAHFEDHLKREVKSATDFAAASRNVLEAARAHLTSDEASERYRVTVVHGVMADLKADFIAYAFDGALDAQEYEQLVLAAAGAGLTDHYAREVVEGLVQDAVDSGERFRLERPERVTLILCANCNRPESLESSRTRCLSCGVDLFRRCPECGSDAPRGEALCRTCGHSMLAAMQFDADLRQAREALSSGRPAQAKARARAALVSETHADAQRLMDEADAAVAKATNDWGSVSTALGQSRLYAARAALRGLAASAIDVEGPTGDLPGETLTRLQAELRAIEDRIANARGLSDPKERERTFAEIIARVSDCDEAHRELAQIAPAPATTVRTRITRDGVQVSWAASSSPGVSGYTLVRGSDQPPALPTDGTLVATTSSMAALDSSAPAGQLVAYAVFAVRAGVSSKPAVAAPRVVAHEARDVAASVDSGEVRLSWRLPAASASVEVERRATDGQVTQLLAGPNGLVDTGLVNDRPYQYTVRLRYGQELTDGVTVTATPAEPPRPVALLGLEEVSDGVAMSWSGPSTGTVLICRSNAALDVSPGIELRRDELNRLGDILPGSNGRATDPAARDGGWYTPITVSGDRAIVGTGLRWTDIPAITDVKAHDAGGEARVTWSWPPDVKHAVVLWREGGAPLGLDDPNAHSQHVARAIHQEVNGGVFRIHREQPTEPLRVQVHGAQMRDGELITGARLAPSSRASIDAGQSKSTISYDVKVSRGLRGRSLELRLLGASALPEVVLVAKPGDIIPLSAEDGQTVARVGGDGAPSQVTLALNSLPPGRPLAVRAFLAAESIKAKYTLREPVDLTSLVLR